MTLLNNCEVVGRRRAQVANLLQHFKSHDYSVEVSKVRVEVSVQVAGCLSNSVQVARQVGRHVLSCLQSRTISY